MSLVIEQKPKYRLIPAGSNIIYTLYDAVTINPTNNKFKIKYKADVYVSNKTANIVSSANRVGVFKVTPNGEGYGIFDFRPILQNYVSPEYTGGTVHNTNTVNNSQYNGVDYTENTPHTIHQIDDFSTNRNCVRFVAVRFNIEAADSATGSVTEQYGSDTIADTVLIYNGVLYDTDILSLTSSSGNFGFNLDQAGFVMNSNTDKFLTNAPTTQYIRENDYLTLSYFSEYDFDFEVGTAGQTHPSVKSIKLQFYYNGSTTGSLITKNINAAAGGHSGYMNDSNVKLQFAGIGTGNLVGAGVTIPTNWDYYTVQAFGTVNAISQEYKFYKQTEDCKEYETIRLTWLNKFGVWDYYNFTKKSVRTFNTQRKSYTQITGTWNTSRFRPDGHTGGTKYFGNNTKESITLNTDYITENEAIWLEELFISNDVYILEQRSTDNAQEGYMRKYIKPTTIIDNTHTRKTKANDRLIQYTYKIEVHKTKKSQLM